MRIDLVITELDTGGAERCCAELALFLSRRAHRVRVIALGPRPESARNALVGLLETNNIELHFLGGKTRWKLPWVASKFWSLLQSDRPDVAQSFLWHANVLSAWIVPRFGIPLFGGVRVAERSKSRHALDRWAASRSVKTVCVSQGVANWCVQTEKMDSSKLVVIPNGIAVSDSKPLIDLDSNSHNVPADARILLFCGRLEQQKGIDILVQQAGNFLGRLPEHHLVCIGDGSLRHRIDELSQQTELRGRVHRLGRRNDVRSWMARSELLLLPSRYEGMPNVILEAMAEGIACVTTRVEGIEELLGNQLTNQSVEKGDWNAFFDLAVHLANSKEQRAAIGLANRTRVEKEFDLANLFLRYEALYVAKDIEHSSI